MPALVTEALCEAIAPHLPDHRADPCGGSRCRPRWAAARAARWRRLPEWTAAEVWNKAHARLLATLGERGLLNLERAVLDSASTRPAKGGRTPARIRPTGPSAA